MFENRSTTHGTSLLTRILVRAAIAGALLSASTLTGLAAYLVRRITVRPRSHRPPHFIFTPWEVGIPYENVRIPSGDGELHGWFLPQSDPAAPAILGLIGLGGNKSDLLGIGKALYGAGFALLMFDFRGTGESSGRMRTLGHTESDDAVAALEWLVRRVQGVPIGAIGYSMGASVAINLAGTDSRVRAVVADSPFASQYGVLSYNVERRTGIPPGAVLAIAEPMFRLRHGRRFADFAPVDFIGKISPRPVFLIHTTEDMLIPISEADILWDAAREPKERWVLDGIAHCGAYFEHREEYCRRVIDFYRRSLSSAVETPATD
jgi:uncharacterized protein